MTQEYFDATLLIREGRKTEVDLSRTPFFCNSNGLPAYVDTLPKGVDPLEFPKRASRQHIGREYAVSAMRTKRPASEYGEKTHLTIEASEVTYEPMRATSKTAAAFGMLLVEPGQYVRMSSPVAQLQQVDFDYGMFAGHWSPYLDDGHRLLGKVCTDLEHHDFPHVFASVDLDLPLVISVGRFWPKLNKIYLADLWLERGHALYVPPRPKAQNPTYIDLHGNRNSALACWRNSEQSSIRTRTLLQTDGGYFYWFWNELPTTHPLLK